MNKSFVFGVATASYQIEGARFEDGRTSSIWDTFSHTPGKIANNDNGDIACDHYHRVDEDVELISNLGVDYYRFSIAWPRIFPQKGVYNEKGMAFYKNLLKKLKSKGIKTAITLYHWDLPQWCQDLGGFPNREVCEWFVDYATKCFIELDDMCDMWITVNEPMCIAELGYGSGAFAPGIKDTKQFLEAWHHLALCHGLTVRKYHELGFSKPIGIVMNTQNLMPYSNSPEDKRASDFAHRAFNCWYLYPLFKGCYPEEGKLLYKNIPNAFDYIQDGDFEIIGEKLDFLGLNYYQEQFLKYRSEKDGIVDYETMYDTDHKKTMLNWNVTPDGIIHLAQLIRELTDLPILISENGSAWRDIVSEDGAIHDTDRIEYLKLHLDAVERANQMGLNIFGYFAWTLLDNFEWAEGYAPKFGLVRTGPEALDRIPKDSYYYYRDYIKAKKNKE